MLPHGIIAGLRRAVLLCLPLAGACSSLPDRMIVPEKLVSEAQVPGFPDVRGWGDELPPLEQLKRAEVPAIRARQQERQQRTGQAEANILAISGGGENGAFGAGLLVGWSDCGTRPEFDLITGVSAGALIAPFAFLGRDYDPKLAELFTRFSGSDIYEASIVSGIFGGSAVASNEPLKQLIARYVDDEMMRRIAGGRAKGRVLLIGTTNLDAERPVYWDVGRIAQKGGRDGLELIRTVLVASAALPGVFPPVRIRVVANGKPFDELHVDGGPTRQVFLSPSDFSFRQLDKLIGRKVRRDLFIIRNGKLGPEWAKSGEGLFAIGQRSLYATTKYQALGDLTRIYSKATADGIGYNLAAIPDDFRLSLPKPFDTTYMKALFEVGHKQGRSCHQWLKSPPGVPVADRN